MRGARVSRLRMNTMLFALGFVSGTVRLVIILHYPIDKRVAVGYIRVACYQQV